MIYVLKMDNPQSPDDTGMPTRVRLVGPFDDDEQAHAWAIDPRNNPHDNPCWQVVDLAEPVVSVEAPHAAASPEPRASDA